MQQIYRLKQQARLYARHMAAVTGLRPLRTDGLHWLFVATLPNSGSTALARVLCSAPAADALNDVAEGQWLMPLTLAKPQRWRPEMPINYGLVRTCWVSHAPTKRPCLMIEKSPPNLVRMRALLARFDDMPQHLIRFTRDPYAICASWAKRYPTARARRNWDPDHAEALTDDASYFQLIGRLAGERLHHMGTLADLAQATLSYERFTQAPAETLATLQAAIPLLDGADPKAAIQVKDYAAQPLRNMNEEQIARLSPQQINWITTGLAPFEADIAEFGYNLRATAAQ